MGCTERGNKLWNAQIVRRQIVEFLEANGDKPMDDGSIGMAVTLMLAIGCETVEEWQAYCDEMSTENVTWGDEVTLVAACTLYRAQISIVSSLADECIQTITSPPFWGALP